MRIIYLLFLLKHSNSLVNKTINISGLFSVTDSSGNILEKGLQRMEAFKYAVNDVNKKYNTNLIIKGLYNDRESISGALSSTHYSIDNYTDILVGPASSSLAQNVGYFIKDFKLPTISYAASSISLSDIKSFPYLSRTIASDIVQVSAFIKIIENFKWGIINIAGTEDLYGTTGVNNIIFNTKAIIGCNYIITSKNYYNDVKELGKCISKSNSKVLILFMNEINSSKIITSLRSQGFIDEETLLLASDSWASNDVITFGTTNVDGFKKDYIKNTIGIIQSPGDLSWFKTHFDSLNPVKNKDPYFLTLWNKYFNCKTNDTECFTKNKLNTVVNPKISFVYDAIEAVAYTVSKLNDQKNEYTALDILSYIRNNTIPVKSGNLTIKDVDRQNDTFDYIFFNGEEWVKIGEYKNNEISIQQNDIYIPLSEPKNLIIAYSNPLSIVTISLIIGDMLIAIFILIYFYTRSEDIQVKLYSVPFSFLLILGLTMIWTSLLLWLGEVNSLKCGFIRWFLYMGITLVISVLIAKNYRLFKIYTNKTIKDTKVTNNEIYFFVSILCGLQFIILLSSIFYGYNPTLNVNQYSPIIRYENCSSNNFTEWGSIIYIGILVVAGALMAFLTRNVPERFNESKYIAFCMYSIFLNFFMLIPVKVINFKDLDNGFYIQNLLNIVIIYFGSNVIFLVLFFSRVLVVYKRQRSFNTIKSKGILKEQTKTQSLNVEESEIEFPEIPKDIKEFII